MEKWESSDMKKIPALPEWTSVRKCCFDPHNKPEIFGPENIADMTIHIKSDSSYSTDLALEVAGNRMTQLEELYVYFSRSYQDNLDFCVPLIRGLQFCHSLKKLDLYLNDDELNYNQSLR